MIAYVKTWLDNLCIQKVSILWAKSGLIEQAEQEGIAKSYITGYKEHGILSRIGIFVFTLIIMGSAFGLLSIFIFSNGRNSDTIAKVVSIFYGLCCYAFAEFFVKDNRFIKTGVMEALLYTAVGFLDAGIVMIVTNNEANLSPLAVSIAVFPLLAFVAIRFADSFLTLLAFISFLVMNALLLFELKSMGKMILPFETMALSFLCYWIIIKQKDKEELRFWSKCITVLEIASLTALYIAGNYMAIRMLTGSLLGIDIGPGEDIGLAPFFYAYTIIVPLIYIGLGLKRKNYIFMRLGLILFATGILSIKYYHSFMPPETALMIGGIAMIVIAWVCIRYLKTPKHGVTFAANEHSEKHKVMADIAGIAISQVMSNHPQPTKPDKQFGGGDFGGGGAGTDF